MLAEIYREELERARDALSGPCPMPRAGQTVEDARGQMLAEYDERIEVGVDPACAAATVLPWYGFYYAPQQHFGYVAATGFTVEGEAPF